jgi:hypothetical protein
LIISDACRDGLAVFALRKASRRCFLGVIAVLALAIHLFAMAASSGSSAQAIADALLIDAGTSVAFGSVPGGRGSQRCNGRRHDARWEVVVPAARRSVN